MKLAKTRLRPAPRDLDLNIHVDTAETGIPSPSQFARWVSAALLGAPRHVQIGLQVLDNEAAQALNREYRGKDYPTNVLSFALSEGETLPNLPLFGHIFFAAPFVAAEAQGQGKTLMAHYAHLTIHGVLHLRGFDHEDEADASKMEALETTLLAKLGYADPYAQDAC